MKVFFTEDGWTDYQHWIAQDADILSRLYRLIEDCRRNRFQGIGKPEPLRGRAGGWWSRRITSEHRLVYRIEGQAGVNQRIEIIQCRYHYAD